MRVDILSTNGSSTGRSIELPKEIFEAEISEHSVYLAVKQYLAAQRQGTHKAKEKAEVNKSTRKIKRQKGTGTARAGSMKNPLFKGGGRMFGSRPRNYGFKLNKKVKAVAKVSALTSLAQEGCIKVIEDFSFDQPKTKDFVKIVNSINTDGGKTLIVTAGLEKNVYLSSRNLQNANVTEVKDLNIYQILNSKNVIFSESSLAKLLKYKTMNKHIIIKPVISEKADILSNNKNQYTFVVNKSANKIEITKALESMFPDVTIESVNTMIMPKKKKVRNTRSGMQRGVVGGHKKAVVTLAEGDSLDIYEQN